MITFWTINRPFVHHNTVRISVRLEGEEAATTVVALAIQVGSSKSYGALGVNEPAIFALFFFLNVNLQLALLFPDS